MRLPGQWPLDDPVGHDWFITGVNYPYIGTFGNDIGPNQILNKTHTLFNASRLQALRDDFNRLKSWGVNAVRIYAFERGEGLTWQQASNYRVVNGINQQYLYNIAAIAQEAQEAGVRIYWCLLQSADFDLKPEDEEDERLMKTSFIFMLHNSRAVDSFLERALRPFIETLLMLPAGLFAIDLMNEPDGLWKSANCHVEEALRRFCPSLSNHEIYIFRQLFGRDPNFRRENTQSERNLLRYEERIIELLARMASFIKANYEVLVSAGFMSSNTFMRSQNLRILNQDFDFFDFHFYDTINVVNYTPNLPSWNDLGINKPCIIGECGLGGQVVKDGLGFPLLGTEFRDMLSTRIGRRLSNRLFSDQPFGQFPIETTLEIIFTWQAVFIANSLNRAKANHFSGCFIWEYGRQFNFVSVRSRLPSETGNCPGLSEDHGNRRDCLNWPDRFPLLWKKHEGIAVSDDMCIHLRTNHPPEELCGRPIVRYIKRFTDNLRSGNLQPNY